MYGFTLNLFNNRNLNKKEHVLVNSHKYAHSGRKNDCETPFRNPYNHWRKTTTCSSVNNSCITNEKIVVDNVSKNFASPACYSPYIRNILNKDGKRTNDFIFSKQLLNEKRNITYKQNTRSAIVGNATLPNHYTVTPKELPASTPLIKCKQNVVKYTNNKFRSNGAVSGKSRVARLKYNTTLLASSGNAINGTLISRQGVGHGIRPPYRNNKYYGNDVKCSQRRNSQRGGVFGLSALRCHGDTGKTQTQIKEDFNFAI